MKRLLWLAMIVAAAYGGHLLRVASVPSCADVAVGQYCARP